MTLQRAVDCSHKEAVDFATMVDREVISYHIFKYPGLMIKDLGQEENICVVKVTRPTLTFYPLP